MEMVARMEMVKARWMMETILSIIIFALLILFASCYSKYGKDAAILKAQSQIDWKLIREPDIIIIFKMSRFGWVFGDVVKIKQKIKPVEPTHD